MSSHTSTPPLRLPGMLQIKILLLLLRLIPYTSFPHHLQPQFGAGAELGKAE